jgi:hypothetical protein
MFEVARSDALDMREPELAEAAAHLAVCPRCRSVLDDRQALDQTIAHVMQDVPVPAGLKEKLLVAVGAPQTCAAVLVAGDEPMSPSPEVPALLPPHNRPQPISRRRWSLIAATAAALCVCVGIGAWQAGWFAPSHLTLDQIRSAATLDVTELRDFDGNFAAEPPGLGWTSSQRLAIALPPRGYTLPGTAHPQLAVFAFRYRTTDGSFVDGALLAVPAARVADPPQPGAFGAGNVEYAHSPDGRFPTVAWTEGDLVYVCVVPENAAGRLDDLEKELRQHGLA